MAEEVTHSNNPQHSNNINRAGVWSTAVKMSHYSVPVFVLCVLIPSFFLNLCVCFLISYL